MPGGFQAQILGPLRDLLRSFSGWSAVEDLDACNLNLNTLSNAIADEFMRGHVKKDKLFINHQII